MDYFCLSQCELAFRSLVVKSILKSSRNTGLHSEPATHQKVHCQCVNCQEEPCPAGSRGAVSAYVPTPTPACTHTCTVGAAQTCDSHVNPEAHVTGRSRRELCRLLQPLSLSAPVHSAVNQSRRPAMPSPRG